jgi:RHS repeat-associated protein
MHRFYPISSASSGLFASGWSSGNYLYDGAGNVTTIGSAWFTYDKVSRLTEGRIYLGPYGGGAQKSQTYSFDPFGNITGIGGTSGRSTPTEPKTNRLTGTGTTYDPAGNLTAWNGATYQYDGFNQMTRMTNGGEDWLYLYTADDERIWSYNVNANFSRWTVRDLSGKVLREWENHQNQYWGIAADTLYRDGQLLAAETGNGRKHFHLDHLGTPRLLTNAVGQKLAYHVYYPFGEEATEFDQDRERMKFTGHERDLGSLAGAGDDLDYMKARFCSPLTARFLGFDPGSSARPAAPQSWNKYVYANNNPIKNLDPDGRESRAALTLDQDIKAVLDGKMSSQEFQQRNQDRAKGAAAGLALLAPGPEDLLIAGVASKLASRLLGKLLARFGDDAARAAQVSRFATMEGRSAVLQKVIRSDGGLNMSSTVERQLTGLTAGKDRQFISVHSILDTIGSGTRVVDPQKVANQFLYTVEATYNGSKGTLSVLVNEKTGKIVHVLFTSTK